jgi:hypothetical protein
LSIRPPPAAGEAYTKRAPCKIDNNKRNKVIQGWGCRKNTPKLGDISLMYTCISAHDVYLGGRAKGEELPESGREVLEKELLVVLVPDERGRRDGM